jgi:enamine deaminase RidA (YjgF/YER057c/UK114 family)
MSIERITTNPAVGFADAVTTAGGGRTIYVSGNVGFGSQGKVVEGGMRAEAHATFDNIERVLRSAGADFSQTDFSPPMPSEPSPRGTSPRSASLT